MSLFKNIEKAKDWVRDKNVKIVLSLIRIENYYALVYDIKAGGRIINHLQSEITPEEFQRFLDKETDIITKEI